MGFARRGPRFLEQQLQAQLLHIFGAELVPNKLISNLLVEMFHFMKSNLKIEYFSFEVLEFRFLYIVEPNLCWQVAKLEELDLSKRTLHPPKHLESNYNCLLYLWF